MWLQKNIQLQTRPRGFHIIAGEIEAALPERHNYKTGLCQLLLKHTSAPPHLNESADRGIPYETSGLEPFFKAKGVESSQHGSQEAPTIAASAA